MITKEATLLLYKTLQQNYYPENYLDELLQYAKIEQFEDENELSAKQESLINHIVTLLKKDVPVEYITGIARFYGFAFKVNSSTLIPRPFTEELVTSALQERLRREKESATIIDIGTGSGAIIVSLSAALKRDFPKIFKKTSFYAVDISKEALEVAQSNAKLNKVDKNITLLNADVFEDMSLIQTFNKICIIVSNPPYIEQKDYKNLPNSVRLYEPESALVRKQEFYDKLEMFSQQIKDSQRSVTVILEDSRDQIPFCTVTSL